MTAPVRVVALVDDPHARADIEDAIDQASDLELLAGVTSSNALWPILHEARPRAIVLDLGGTGPANAELCLDIRRLFDPPEVVVYSSNVGHSGAVAAALAGAAAVFSRSTPPALVIDTLRAAVAGSRPRAEVPLTARSSAALLLDPSDHPIFAMRLAGEGAASIAQTLGLPCGAVVHRIRRIIAALETGVARPERLAPAAGAS